MFPSKQGLSTQEVLDKQRQFGLNVLPQKPPPSHVTLVLRQLKNPLMYVLLVAGVATALIGHVSDAIIISLAVVLNTTLGFIQERKATNALHALKRYVTSKATVIRDGTRCTVDATQLVPGDIVLIHQGGKIPADGTLTHANRLFLDESALTGESASVSKEHGDAVYMGTTAATGQATMVVTQIGAETKMGKIAAEIQEDEEETPFQKQLNVFSKQLVVVIGACIGIVFGVGLLYRFPLTEIFVTSVALAVASIPEGLLVSLTVVLAIGMQKILKHRGLVRKLSAAETLGGVTVICVDKTGTLTEGKMEVVEHVGDTRELAEQVLLANDLDDPIVIAAHAWGKTILDDAVLHHTRLDSIPFSSSKRYFVSLHEWSTTQHRMYVNGAPEILLAYTTLGSEKKKEIMAEIHRLTLQGKRVVGYARKDVPLTHQKVGDEDAHSGLLWVGMLAFSDPVRLGVKEVLERTVRAGIRTIVITGDYAKTAAYVLAELGTPVAKQETMTGDELRTLSLESIAQKVRHIRLFARTTPEQKLIIVEALKKHGEVVAMMGDGVNDAPALHTADIGVAVGEATDVAKEAADVVLLDSNFSTIVNAIEEGRAMFENIRKIILYLLCDAFAEIFVVMGTLLLGLPLPLTAIQILWINLVSDGFPSLSLTVDPKRTGLMSEKPRSPRERIVNGWMFALIGFASMIAGLLTLISFLVVYTTTGDLLTARSMAFVILGLNSLMYVFSVRGLMTPFWKNKVFENRWLVGAVVLGFVLHLLPFSTSGLRAFFGLTGLSTLHWVGAIGLSISMFFVIEAGKYVYGKMHGTLSDTRD